MQEHDIVARVLEAQKSTHAADELIEQYLPFIRSETAKFLGRFPTEDDDEVSIAMFAFYEAAMSYRSGRGAFLKLATTAIRNRLIDYRRREARHQGHLSLDTPVSADDDRTLAEQTADESAHLELHQHREDTRQEIAHFVLQLSEFGLSLADIAENCPRQKRTTEACMAVLSYARKHPELLRQLVSTRKLPLEQLARGAGVSRKLLERQRKYIVAILLAYTNGFEILRGHLQSIGKKEVMAL